ncbi:MULTISPECIES: LysR family transcriptional regulator [unclassified Rhizobium]|jgi:DNA-binding transcriptional LysR family regulator|uniref:LysR family transcriptional regulator n=1 Tax=unclassified Rhizobium TaxID=2613769 RepID=UPI0006464BD3|nr:MULTISPECIES: LysR family transcriptional regulator [unclassified Rhizobium]OJY79649.1 MAG: hypothetical protein BGP09_08555 [Rhizobium sp. 60-20]
MDRFNEMTAFHAVATLKSFTKAAETLGTSRPAMSRHIAALESRLGTRLLQRSTRHVALTEEGRAFFTRCVEALEIIEDAEQNLLGNAGSAVGVLRVSIPSSFGLHYLMNAWPELLTKAPRLSLDIDLSDRPVDLIGDGFDVALRIGEAHSADLVRRRVSTMKMVLCASPEFIRRHGMPVHPNELKKFVVAAVARDQESYSWEFLVDGSPRNFEIRPRVKASSGHISRSIALGHQALVLEPHFLVAEDLKDGRLIEVMSEFPSPERNVYAVYPSRKHISSKVRFFVDFMKDTLAGSSLPSPR